MRLSQHQKAMLLEIVRNQLGSEATVWVYGSRLDDQRRGGDLDLVIESKDSISLLQRADLKLRLENALQIPVDVLTYQQGSPPSAFQGIALAQAIRLEHAA